MNNSLLIISSPHSQLPELQKAIPFPPPAVLSVKINSHLNICLILSCSGHVTSPDHSDPQSTVQHHPASEHQDPAPRPPRDCPSHRPGPGRGQGEGGCQGDRGDQSGAARIRQILCRRLCSQRGEQIFFTDKC